MPKLNERGVAQIFVILILLAGMVGGLYLVQHPTFFRPKAASTGSRIEIGGSSVSADGTITTSRNVKVKVYYIPPSPSPSAVPTNSASPASNPNPYISATAANAQPKSAVFYGSYSGPTSSQPNSYIVDLSTDSKMSTDVYLSFGSSTNTTITVNDPVKWDKYGCIGNTPRTLYWRIRSGNSNLVSPPNTDGTYPSFTVPASLCVTANPSPVGVGGSVKGVDTSLYFIVDNSQMELDNDQYKSSKWRLYSGTPTEIDWTLSDGNESKMIFARFGNITNNTFVPINTIILKASIVLKVPAPTPSPTPSPSPTPTPTPSSTPSSSSYIPQTVKVWMLQYYPSNNSSLDRVSFTKNTLIPAVNEASKYHGYSDVNAQPALKYVLADGDIKTENNPPPRRANPINIGVGLQPVTYDYEGMFQKYDLCNLAKQNDIKAVMIWADGTGAYGGGGFESAITGNKGISTNGNNFPVCPDKTIVVYMFNYTRGLAEALESYGHHLERVFGQFRSEYYQWNDRDSCGTDHNPPNSRFEYDRSNTTSFQSDCRNWKPNNQGAKESLNCATWGCDDGAKWIKFWMQNMPGVNNGLTDSSGQKIPNWWVYIGDPDKCYNNPLGCYSGGNNLVVPSAVPIPTSTPTPTPQSNVMTWAGFLKSYGKTKGYPGYDPLYDADNDGFVNVYDYFALKSQGKI